MSKPSQVIPEKAIGYQVGTQQRKYEYIDCITYALGIGFNRDPTNEDHLFYTNELKDDEFKVFPTCANTIGKFSDALTGLINCPGMPDFNPMMLLHGEQDTILHKKIRVGQNYVTESVMSDIADKKKGAVITISNKSFEADDNGKKGEIAFENIGKIFIRGIGGFGFPGKNKSKPFIKPKGAATKTLSQKTEPNDAFIYRLAGDFNPLHIDPNMAAMGGFDKPILHGLCFYGVTAKLLIENLCGGDETQLKAISGRFTSHVFPGETIVVNAWVSGNHVIFESSTKERGLTVIQGEATLAVAPKL